MKVQWFVRCSMLCFLPILAAPGLAVDPCPNIGHPPKNITVLVGKYCVEAPPSIQGLLSSRDSKYLQLVGRRSNSSSCRDQPCDPPEIAVGFDIPYDEPLTAFRVFVELKAYGPVLLQEDLYDYDWVDEAALVCDEYRLIVTPWMELCEADDGTFRRVLEFQFQEIPEDCVSANPGGEELLHVRWNANMKGEHLAGEDYREVDRLVIDP